MAKTVYREYDQAALDAQYNARAAVPAFDAFARRWELGSERAARELPCTLDVAYGESDAETMDIFHPVGGGPGPVLMFFHGGYWRSADKAWFRFLARPFVERGATVLLPNYGLCPSVDIDEIVRQCRASVIWTLRNAPAYGGDEARLFVSGHSAGGHIAAMMLATEWTDTDSVSPHPIKGITTISGLYDLEPLRLCFVNEDLRLTEESVARNSPTSLPLPDVLPPVIAAVGALESNEFRRQTVIYTERLRQTGDSPLHVEVAGHHHYSVLDAMANPDHPFGATVMQQIGLA